MTQDLEGTLRAGGPVRGVLRLGGSDGFAMVCLGECLNALKPSHPDLRVAVTVGNSRMLEQKLQDGELDLAILSDAHATRELRTRVLGQQEIAWVGSAALDLGPAPTTAELLGQQIFTNPAPSHLFTVLMDWFGASGLPSPPLSSCDSVAVIANLVAAGAGISILPVCIVQPQLAAGTCGASMLRPRRLVSGSWPLRAGAATSPALRRSSTYRADRGDDAVPDLIGFRT